MTSGSDHSNLDEQFHPEFPEFHEASNEMSKRNYDNSIAILKDGIQNARHEGDTLKESFYLFTIAQFLVIKGERDEALGYFKEALSIDDEVYQRLLYASYLNKEYGKHSEALSIVTEAIRQNQDDDQLVAHASTIAGCCLIDLGEHNKALEAFHTFYDLSYGKLKDHYQYDLCLVAKLVDSGISDVKIDRYIDSAIQAGRRGDNKYFLKHALEISEKNKKTE